MAHTHSHAAGDDNAKRLLLAFGVTATFMIIEVIGGLVSGSLALLADAGHMRRSFSPFWPSSLPVVPPIHAIPSAG